jgi:hypothetical protein
VVAGLFPQPLATAASAAKRASEESLQRKREHLSEWLIAPSRCAGRARTRPTLVVTPRFFEIDLWIKDPAQ